ncbi:hypothetical protein CDL15_Pgr003207 [Punica granatum]|uniref:DUF7138 domain-containing protein n=1 Tax=Punica granatum TaxID=22663 RepID=A0A218X2V8_PUNGR|nr:hypothetical protein CDL15_Pgr003207 [Punica granatum]PKI42979.1 hypothetical protein CRG98_036777 [Punica granatum]
MIGDGPAGISLPVILHDGEKEISIGYAAVRPTMKFNELQSGISQRVGLSPHQISIYLAERRLYRSWPRKVAINAKFNFATITGGKDLYFLVFLKRSRAREKIQSFAKQRPPENVMLLRRDTAMGDQMYGGGYGVPVVDAYEYDRRVRELAAERERYLMMTMTNSNNNNNAPLMKGVEEVFCEGCEKAKETVSEPEPDFHWCRNDAVIAGFRSRAGPVSRPGKKN